MHRPPSHLMVQPYAMPYSARIPVQLTLLPQAVPGSHYTGVRVEGIVANSSALVHARGLVGDEARNRLGYEHITQGESQVVTSSKRRNSRSAAVPTSKSNSRSAAVPASALVHGKIDPGSSGYRRIDPGSSGYGRVNPGSSGYRRIGPGTSGYRRVNPGTSGYRISSLLLQYSTLKMRSNDPCTTNMGDLFYIFTYMLLSEM